VNTAANRLPTASSASSLPGASRQQIARAGAGSLPTGSRSPRLSRRRFILRSATSAAGLGLSIREALTAQSGAKSPMAPSLPVAEFVVEDPDGSLGQVGAPVCLPVTLSAMHAQALAAGRLFLREDAHSTAGQRITIPLQFERAAQAQNEGRLWFLMPPGRPGPRVMKLEPLPKVAPAVMATRQDPASGQFDLTETDRPVLRYNYQAVEPGAILNSIASGNRIYARPRSNYIHPLYGLSGEIMTKDWSVDHPHHRGIYWAWPEVDYHGERADLHALQRVFARPTGKCLATAGAVFAQVKAENLWQWDDREPIVREVAIVRAWRAAAQGRCVDLEFQFQALGDDVAIARRGASHYGGLNLRMAAVKNQQIIFRSDPAEAKPRMAWAELAGLFPAGSEPGALAVFEKQANPDYPGEWVKYPELNWFQPTFPASGRRHLLKKDQPLLLQFRLWIRPGVPLTDPLAAAQWRSYQALPAFTPAKPS
jgi:hypothetical protein